ncbi:hypothetical protein SAMN06265338_103209 [Rhodoblastus acidophilus]|uniref:Uncharacterized protein n=1 Tax=Rhodoblastus acidophilus TaxID=1074 RepID=A0A212RB29_RHOAC|nr:hypothetical protein CKO16_06315 [Rhodoblastus acidophilus]RAI22436.1 hypothetical protein CH337_05510 [Rhodoblastus acidophilus]SNB69383.1 hypothetical protein SAMN06265338_103209 [Rhodoblastus acidophilus]
MIENHRVGVGRDALGGGRPPSILGGGLAAGAALKPASGLPPRGVQSHTQGPLGLAWRSGAEINWRAPEGPGGRVAGFKGVGPGE